MNYKWNCTVSVHITDNYLIGLLGPDKCIIMTNCLITLICFWSFRRETLLIVLIHCIFCKCRALASLSAVINGRKILMWSPWYHWFVDSCLFVKLGDCHEVPCKAKIWLGISTPWTQSPLRGYWAVKTARVRMSKVEIKWMLFSVNF